MVEMIPQSFARLAVFTGTTIAAVATIAAVTRAAGALARAGSGDGGRHDGRRVGFDFEDAEAEDAVGDLQVVVERVEEIGRRLEAVPAVVGLGAAIDFVRHLAQPPGVLTFQAAGGLDLPTRLLRQGVPGGGVELGIQHQHKLIFTWRGQSDGGL